LHIVQEKAGSFPCAIPQKQRTSGLTGSVKLSTQTEYAAIIPVLLTKKGVGI
jgi:hypothetical protein